MSLVHPVVRSPWFLGFAAGCVVVSVLAAILGRTSVSPFRLAPASNQTPRSLVQFSEPQGKVGGGVLQAHSAMSDLTPLFLPSDRNARLPALPLREPGDGALDAQNPKFRFRDADAAVLNRFPPTTTLNGTPLSQVSEIDLLQAIESVPLASGFGRLTMITSPRQSRGGVIEVYASGSGQLVAVDVIAETMRPAWPQLWQPLEFLAAVESSGLVSPLSLTVASRVDAVDAFFRDYLVRTFRLGERLAPGFYRVVVSP